MKKLWKVKVNNWGWDSPQTRYFESREEAQAEHDRFPAADDVEYAGRFTDEKADKLTGKASEWDY